MTSREKRRSPELIVLLSVLAALVAGSTLLNCGGGGGDAPPAPAAWPRTFGGLLGDRGQTVEPTPDGGYIISGFTYSSGAGLADAYLIKTDALGRAIWTKTFGGPYYDRGECVRQTSDGGYIVAGWLDAYGPGGGDVYLVKTDAAGNKIWDNTYGGIDRDMGFSVQQTSDGGYVVAGYTFALSASGYDVYLVKTDAAGRKLWEKTFGASGPDIGYDVVEASDGGYVIAGRTMSFGAGLADVFLVKTDASGEMVWQKTFGGSGNDGGEAVRQTSDGGYIVAGSTASFGAGGTDVYLIKTDGSGAMLWQRTFGGPGNDNCFDVRQTSDGGYILAGATDSFGAGLADVYLIKTDADGNAVWTKTIGGGADDAAFSVRQTSEGGYIVSGYTVSFGADPDGDVYLIKTDADGNVAGL